MNNINERSIKGISSFFTCLVIASLIVNESGAQSDRYNLSFPADNFSEDALLDLSYLNENVAGENGFIALSDDGESFVNGNGDEIRFWAIGGGDVASRNAFRALNNEQLAYYAKFLAKKGVNMIRYHGGIHSVTNDLNQVNTEAVEDIWRLVAAMKKEGIYTTISPFWAGHMGNMPAAWDLGDYKGEVKPWGLMYFESKFKEAYKTWVEYLYNETNPHTGMALKDDPAVGIIQIKNEDGVFFWTIQDVKPSLKAVMESQYYSWLINKYGTISAAYASWENDILEEDDVANGRMGLYIIWHATQPQSGGRHKRLTDQIAFYAETQRNFYQEMYDHYRSIGCKQIINGNNWKTADALRLFDAERWTNEVCDVMAVNRYVDPGHIGDNSGWRIEPGHHYVGNSVMKQPHNFPINVKQVAGKAFIMSESAWNLPNKYQAEGPFLIAAYMSLTGFDGYYWFSPSSYTYDANPYWDFAQVNGQVPMFRWTVSTPGQIGMFPANALMYRKGFIAKGEVVVHEERTLQSVFEREIPMISEENSFDPNRDNYENNTEAGETEIAPIAYLAGQVRVVYDGNPANSVVSPSLGNLLDFQNKKVSAITGELTWDYTNGMCVLDAPSAKGICGFPGSKQRYELTDVTINTKNEYVVVNVVSMDDLPVNQSEKVLIQIGTTYRPTGWIEQAASFQLGGQTVQGFEIRDVGKMPWRAQNSEVSVVINNPNIQSARLLNMNGYESREIYVMTNDTNDHKEIKVPANGMYIIADTRPASVLGLDELQGKVSIYPNPAEGFFNIKIDDEGLDFTHIDILDLTGKVLRKFNHKSDHYELKLPEGAYLVQLSNKEGLVMSKKIIIGK
jgi:hypothetical protein